GYIELQVTSNFSFLRGASHPEELVEQAASLGYEAIGIADRNSLAGVVRAHVAARKHRIRFILGCRLDLLDGSSLLAYPKNKKGYSQLCSLLSTGNLRAEKGKCHLYKKDVYAYKQDIIFVVVPPDTLSADFELDAIFIENATEYAAHLKGQIYLGLSRTYQGDDAKRLFRLYDLAERLHIPVVALGDVHYHIPERRALQDILTCIREKCTIYTAGFRLHPNAERYLKPQEEMERLFAPYPEALEHTFQIADACRFSLDELEYVYPEELTQEGCSPQEELEIWVWQGAKKRFNEEELEKHTPTIQMELDFIRRKNYASYFLTVYDYVRFRSEERRVG